MSIAALPRTWKKPPLIRSAWLRWTLIVGAVVYLALVFETTPVNWIRVWEGLPRGAAFVAAFFPPDFVSRWPEIVEGISESLWMTVVSTVIGIAISIPLMVIGAQMMLWLLDRFPWLMIAGSGLLGWIAGELAISDPIVAEALGYPGAVVHYAVAAAGALFVIALGLWLARRQADAARPT